MVAGYAVHAQPQRQQEIPEAAIGRFRIVLNEVAGDQHAVRAPVGRHIVIEGALQRVRRRDAAQLAVEVGEQVRIRQLQDPYRVIRRLNRRTPSSGSARACTDRPS